MKGCYLGQETVARIDALGHVNRTLVGVRFVGPDVPPPGCPLSAEGAVVGEVTSAAYSPRLAVPLALAFVRRGHNAPGTPLESPVGDAEVVGLPVELSASGAIRRSRFLRPDRISHARTRPTRSTCSGIWPTVR